jgi:hypothetical protein
VFEIMDARQKHSGMTKRFAITSGEKYFKKMVALPG